jgi:hypothetical protein
MNKKMEGLGKGTAVSGRRSAVSGQKPGTLEPWNSGTLEPWNPGTINQKLSNMNALLKYLLKFTRFKIINHMETTVRSLSKEIKGYIKQITEDQNLTSVQKIEHDDSLRKALQDKGVFYGTKLDKDSKSISYYYFNFPGLQVSDKGIISDINPKGDFPVSIKLDDNITISYEPRNLKKVKKDYRRDISNAELAHLQLGSEYAFQGEIVDCRYDPESEKYHFNIAGGAESLADKDNLSLATKAAFRRAVVEAFMGLGTGIIVYIGIGIILWIHNIFSEKDIFMKNFIIVIIIVVCIIAGALHGYYSKFSEIRSK